MTAPRQRASRAGRENPSESALRNSARAHCSDARTIIARHAALAGETIRKRIGHLLPLRVDLIGALSIFGDDAGELMAQGYAGASRDVRLRVAGVHLQKEIAEKLGFTLVDHSLSLYGSCKACKKK